MKNLAKRQPMHLNFKAIFDGLFAYWVVTDYFPDWALASNYQQAETLDTIYRNHK